MNKNAVIGIIILIILVVTGLVYITNVYKVDSEVPYITSNLNNGNTEYNNAIQYLNNRNYAEAQKRLNNSLEYYNNAREKTEMALKIVQNKEDSILEEYFKLTISEIDTRINAINEINEAIKVKDTSSSLALSHYTNSNNLMNNSTQYAQNRSQIEQQHPEKFISG